MSTPRKPGVCPVCNGERPPGRPRYCSVDCAAIASANRVRERKAARLGACQRCGGEKSLGIRGAKLCDECRRLVADSSAQFDRERRRRAAARDLADRVARGEEVLVKPVVYREGEKWCPRCKEYRPLTSYPARRNLKKPQGYCTPCQRAYNQERRMRLIYGITWDEYEFLLASQNYRCAICDGRPRKHALSVDHDHQTGEIRGLLCSRCNHKLLGSANDDPARLRKAADYLEAFGAREVFGEPKFVPGSAAS